MPFKYSEVMKKSSSSSSIIRTRTTGVGETTIVLLSIYREVRSKIHNPNFLIDSPGNFRRKAAGAMQYYGCVFRLPVSTVNAGKHLYETVLRNAANRVLLFLFL